jgi:hypothetical protein
MILHASFAVDHPHKAASAVAQLLGGEAFPFPELGEHAWIAMAGDPHGTLVEFLQRGTEFHYEAGKPVRHRAGKAARESASHILLETPLPEHRVLAIANEYGCRAHRTLHGPLPVIEFWFDDCLLIEIATVEMAAAYRSAATISNVRTMVAAPSITGVVGGAGPV